MEYGKQSCCTSPTKTFSMPKSKPDMWNFTVSMVMKDMCKEMMYNDTSSNFYHIHELLSRPIGECTTNVLGSSVKFTCEGDYINEHVYIDAANVTGPPVPKIPNCTGSPLYIMPIRNTCNKYSWGSMLATWDGYCMQPKMQRKLSNA